MSDPWLSQSVTTLFQCGRCSRQYQPNLGYKNTNNKNTETCWLRFCSLWICRGCELVGCGCVLVHSFRVSVLPNGQNGLRKRNCWEKGKIVQSIQRRDLKGIPYAKDPSPSEQIPNDADLVIKRFGSVEVMGLPQNGAAIKLLGEFT